MGDQLGFLAAIAPEAVSARMEIPATQLDDYPLLGEIGIDLKAMKL